MTDRDIKPETTSPPTALELARELRALCRNFEPSFRLIGNMRGDDIERVAVAVLDLHATVARLTGDLDEARTELDELHNIIHAQDVTSGKVLIQRDRLRSALKEACDICDEMGYGHGDIPMHRRIQELRRLAADGSE